MSEGQTTPEPLSPGDEALIGDLWAKPPLKVEPPDPPEPRSNGNGPVPGYDFITDPRSTARPLWGKGNEILWARGEPLLIAAPTGNHKTTIAQQLCLARLRGGEVLGYPVEASREKVLYIAADRPIQARRSWRRMVDPDDELLLNAQLRVLERCRVNEIIRQAKKAKAETVFIDALGTVSPDVNSNEGGMQVYHILQNIIAEEIDVCVLHHTRKMDDDRKRGIDDIFGSQWLTAVMGSVLLLEQDSKRQSFMRHVKQPAETVGPLRIRHDHELGRSHAEKWTGPKP